MELISSDAVLAFISRNAKTIFHQCRPVFANLAIESKSRLATFKNGAQEGPKCASRSGAAANQIGQALILKVVFTRPRINFALARDRHIQPQAIGCVLADPGRVLLPFAAHQVVAGMPRNVLSRQERTSINRFCAHISRQPINRQHHLLTRFQKNRLWILLRRLLGRRQTENCTERQQQEHDRNDTVSELTTSRSEAPDSCLQAQSLQIAGVHAAPFQ